MAVAADSASGAAAFRTGFRAAIRRIIPQTESTERESRRCPITDKWLGALSAAAAAENANELGISSARLIIRKLIMAGN